MRRIFIETDLESDITTQGYAVLRNFASLSDCDKLSATYEHYSTGEQRAFSISNWTDDRASRLNIFEAVTSILTPLAKRHFDRYRPVMGVFTAKTPGQNSEMPIHQDWSLVDESRYRSLSVWLALSDVNRSNGNLQIAIKSHLYAAAPRGMNIPVPFLELSGELQSKYMTDIPLSKGDAIIFDHRVLHCSPVNTSDTIRLAAVMAMIPDEADLIHYYYDPSRESELEILKLEEEQFLLMDFFDTSSKPAHTKSLGTTPYQFKKTSISDIITTSEAKRFEYPFFRDPSIQQDIARNGYSVQPLLNTDQVSQLKRDFNSLLEQMNEPLPDSHWTSGRVQDVTIRNFARQAIDRIIPGALEKYFDPDTTDLIGGIFLAKKPSATSELSSHQDSSHTDERHYPSVYAWVALCDTNISNGAMHVLPGSHLWGNRFRSLNVPWLFSGFQKMMTPFLKAIPMRAGEVLFFDSASIHYSSSNRSNEIRPAINFYIKPKEALFLHHFVDEQTPDGKVEVYNVDIDFFYNHDFMLRPPCPPYIKLGVEDAVEKMTEEKLLKLMTGE